MSTSRFFWNICKKMRAVKKQSTGNITGILNICVLVFAFLPKKV